MKVHCDEGVAIHVAPDLCAGVREGVGEASVGERIADQTSSVARADLYNHAQRPNIESLGATLHGPSAQTRRASGRLRLRTACTAQRRWTGWPKTPAPGPRRGPPGGTQGALVGESASAPLCRHPTYIDAKQSGGAALRRVQCGDGPTGLQDLYRPLQRCPDSNLPRTDSRLVRSFTFIQLAIADVKLNLLPRIQVMPAAQGFLCQAAIIELRVVPGDNVDNSAVGRANIPTLGLSESRTVVRTFRESDQLVPRLGMSIFRKSECHVLEIESVPGRIKEIGDYDGDAVSAHFRYAEKSTC